ncbi:TolC family protein [bacterium]|nr:TolC family protein [bacterium]
MWQRFNWLFFVNLTLMLGLSIYASFSTYAQETEDRGEYEVVYEDEEGWEEFDEGDSASADEAEVEVEKEYFPEPEFKEEIAAEKEITDEEISKEDLLPAVVEEEDFEITEEDVGELEEEPEMEVEKEVEGEEEEGEEEYYYDEEYEDEYWEEEEGEEFAEIEEALEESKQIPTILTNLEDCKRVALLNNPRVQVALREVKYERYKVLEAEREFLPQLKGSWERNDGKFDEESNEDSVSSSLKYGLETNQKIFTSGRNVYNLKQAKTKLLVAKKKFEQARQEAIYNVERAYYELVKTQMAFEIQADLSKAAEAALSFAREAYRQGLNSYQEFLNVQSQTDQTYYQLLSSQQDIALAELELRQACNVDAAVGIQINAVLTFTDFDFNYSLDECLGLGFKNRPDLAMNEFTTLADLYGIKMSMAEDLPQIEFVGQVGKNGQSDKEKGLELSDEWSVKLQASWILGANSTEYSWENKKSVPTKYGQQDNTTDSKKQSLTVSLFDKFENFSNLAKSKVDKATSEADLIELRGSVANEVEENYFNYQKAMTMVTASLSKIKFREKDLEINSAKQMMDEIPLSQVLTSELQLGEERVNYVQALADYYTSIAGLFKAMGLSK